MSLVFKVGTVLPSGQVAYIQICGLQNAEQVPAAISQFIKWVHEVEAKNREGENQGEPQD